MYVCTRVYIFDILHDTCVCTFLMSEQICCCSCSPYLQRTSVINESVITIRVTHIYDMLTKIFNMITYGVATTSRLLKIIDLFCKRAL